MDKQSNREQYLRAQLSDDGNSQVIVKLLAKQGSAALSGLSDADVLAVIPPDIAIHKGDMIDVIPLSELLN